MSTPTIGKRDFIFKVLAVCMYSEGELDYIKRVDNRFLIKSSPMAYRFSRTAENIRQAFKSLENSGYIYNLSLECGSIRFTLNVPPWLTLKEKAPAGVFNPAIPETRR